MQLSGDTGTVWDSARVFVEKNWKILFGTAALATVGAIMYSRRQQMFGDAEGTNLVDEIYNMDQTISDPGCKSKRYFDLFWETVRDLDSNIYKFRLEYLMNNVRKMNQSISGKCKSKKYQESFQHVLRSLELAKANRMNV